MAPLYKRYIPPKISSAPIPATSSAPVSVPSVVNPKPPPAPVPEDGSKKRKRVRTEEEVAERKAKKLRKKNIDPATVKALPVTKSSKDAAGRTKAITLTSGTAEEATDERQGEFAHIKNAKKRHKLEKEARNARKAAAKADKENVPDDAARDKEESHFNPAPRRGQHVQSTSESARQSPQSLRDVDVPLSERKKKRKTKHDVVSVDEDNTPHSTSIDEPARTPAKRSQDERDDNADITQSHDESLEDATSAEPLHNGALSKPKKRRHKLESILTEPQDEGEAKKPDDDKDLKKHGRVLGKFQKSTKLSQLAPQPESVEAEETGSKPIVLDLAPLPQPESIPVQKFVPDLSAFPTWLAKPTIVSSDSGTPFSDLKLHPKTVQHLSKLGFNDALPVQQALIPILLPPGAPGAQYLPGTESMLPDVAVGAPTGSGKTIAYLLPIIGSIAKVADLGRLKAVVVVPTRELVFQVAAVAESLAWGSSLKVGMATGAGSFKDEQGKLVRHGRKYDPSAYRELIGKAHRRNYPPPQGSEEFEDYLDELENQDPREEQRIQDTVACLVDHVPTYESSIDILVSTPGRLLEHLNSTLGFSLAHLEWLVLDEADKLLDLQYDGFLETINNELSRPRHEHEQDAREKYLRSSGSWNEQRERRVRKVVLSATMTKDISKLIELKLKRPQLILVRGSEQATNDTIAGTDHADIEAIKERDDGFELPPTLNEYCVPVGDGSEKPLFLVELLRTRVFTAYETPLTRTHNDSENDDNSDAAGSDDDSSSDLDSSLDSESSTSSSSHKESSDGEKLDVNDLTPGDPSEATNAVETMVHPERTAMLERLSQRQTATAGAPSILIFTSSTETANRLSHLLKDLKPEWASWIATMTKSDSKRKTQSKAPSKEPTITISTDRAGRGLDAIRTRTVTHVIQYDVPRSVTGYVHRVGRTARAGRPGDAWTLYTHSEARWFLKEVAYSKNIKRAEPVEKVKMDVDDDDMKDRLREVVDSMREEVFGRG